MIQYTNVNGVYFNGFKNYDYKSSVEIINFNNIPITTADMDSMFTDCPNLTTVNNMPDNVEVMDYTFTNCQKLVNVSSIPASVQSIEYGFMGCSNLVNAPDFSKASHLDDMAGCFSNCQKLVNAPVIPSSVSTLTDTFSNCSNIITAPTIPNSVSDMVRTFQNCSNLAGNIHINSVNVSDARNCFNGTSQTKNVYISFTYVNGVNTTTYNAFTSAGYDTNGTTNGVYLTDYYGGNYTLGTPTNIISPDNYGKSAVDGNTFYFVTNTHIYRSTDAGSTWNSISYPDNFPSLQWDIPCVAAADGKLYLALWTYEGQEGFWKSSDGGQHWENLPLPTWAENSPQIDKLEIYDGTIIMIGLNYSYITSDEGQNWVTSSRKITFDSSYCWNGEKLMSTWTNWGECNIAPPPFTNWTQIYPPPTGIYVTYCKIGWVAVYESGPHYDTLTYYVSTDDGENWIEKTVSLQTLTELAGGTYTQGANAYIRILPKESTRLSPFIFTIDIYNGGTGGTFYTFDGENWGILPKYVSEYSTFIAQEDKIVEISSDNYTPGQIIPMVRAE